MQTLANLSSSRDVLKQVEINNGAIARMEGYYANYKEALIFQLDQRKPDLLESLSGGGSGSGIMSGLSRSGSNNNISVMSAVKVPPGAAAAGAGGRRVASATFAGTSTHTPNSGMSYLVALCFVFCLILGVGYNQFSPGSYPPIMIFLLFI